MITTLEVNKDVEMLLRSQQIEQNIVLRTDSHSLAHFVHFAKEIIVEDASTSRRFGNETCHH